MIVTLNGITIIGITTTKTDLRRAGHLVLHETAFTLEEPRWGGGWQGRDSRRLPLIAQHRASGHREANVRVGSRQVCEYQLKEWGKLFMAACSPQ